LGFPHDPLIKLHDANGEGSFSPTLIKAQWSKPGKFYFFHFIGIINCNYVPQKQITKNPVFDLN
jgi:hypothetical protein